MSRAAARVLAVLLILVGAPAAFGQQSRPPSAATAAKPAEVPVPPPEPPPPPYEREILRLSEILGSLAFLRSLCTAADAPQWTQRMQALLEAEGTSQGRRDRLAGAYNRGYRAFSLTYRACTPSAVESAERYLREGAMLSQTLSSRYGG